MAETKVIFNRNIINKNIESFNYGDLSKKNEIIKKWINFEKSGVLDKTKETALQTDFLNDFFGEILGYKSTLESSEEWTLDKETKTKADETRADGALGFFSQKDKDIKVVIELKDSKTKLDERQTRLNDRRTPIEQAFSYASKSGKSCNWVIVSNYKEIRLYNAKDYNEYEVFCIKELSNEIELKRFIFMLTNKNLISKEKESLLDILYRKNIEAEEEISKKFYSDYKKFRMNLFNHIKEKNSNVNEILIFEKTQKLIDRFIFICFCEDTTLLEEKTIRKLVEVAKKRLRRSNTKIWSEMKDLFLAIDLGSPEHNINRFNGGLFAEDKIIDNFTIEDDIFEELALISDYDFASDLNVNILGHIFEQSLNDIEEIKASLSGENFDEKKGKRKKDGIFYTPEYITKYIVKEAIGSWLEDRKIELGFYELPELTEEDKKVRYKSKNSYERKYSKNSLEHIEFWKNYKEKLKSIKVLDPACGSGAFLNQAFDYLKVEGEKVNDELSKFNDNSYSVEDVSVNILKNNIFGVDLNEESVEITKLSLWLKTAKKTDPLTSLDENIKCGNSLIDDESIAGEKAFKWEVEFKEIMDNGGFDVVIGNPPYVVLNPSMLEKYSFIKGNSNTYIAFIEKSLKIVKNNAKLGYIIPNTWFSGDNYNEFRAFLLNNLMLKQIIQLPYDIFEAYVDTSVVILSLNNSSEIVETYKFNIKERSERINIENFEKIKVTEWTKFKKIFLEGILLDVGNKILSYESNHLLGSISKINRGSLPPKEEEKSMVKNEFYDIEWFDNQIFRYCIEKESNKKCYVNYNSLKENKTLTLFNSPKILARQLMSRQFRMNLSYVEDSFAFKKNLYAIYEIDEKFNPKYILALLNSRLFSFYQVKFNASLQRDDFPAFSLNDFKNFSIPQLNKSTQDIFAVLAQKQIEVNKKIVDIKISFFELLKSRKGLSKINNKIQNFFELSYLDFLNELKKSKITISLFENKEYLEYFETSKQEILNNFSEIEKADKEIDKMVYELYGLTEDEIKLVEESVQ